jgi:hypothetical protein
MTLTPLTGANLIDLFTKFRKSLINEFFVHPIVYITDPECFGIIICRFHF